MMQKISGLLSPEEVMLVRNKLAVSPWIDGRATTGHLGAEVKSNQQVDTASQEWQELQRYVLDKLNSHPQFSQRPCRSIFPARCLTVTAKGAPMVFMWMARCDVKGMPG